MAVRLVIPKALQQSVAGVEYVISASDMVTMSGTLPIVGNAASGTITGIVPGSDRLFVLNAYGASGVLSHTGSALAVIVAGVTADVRIQLLPVSGSADVDGDFGDTPLFPKALELIGTWQLEVAATENFDFSYTFEAGGRFSNRVSGAFLSALKQLDELQGIDFGQLDQFDGGTLVLSGTWTPGDGTLDLDFDKLDIELFGSLPLIGRIDVGILEENLGEGSEFELAFTCSISDDQLRLRGPSLTLGVPLAAEDAAGTAVDELTELSGIGKAGLLQIGSVVGSAISDRNLDEVVLVRVQ